VRRAIALGCAAVFLSVASPAAGHSVMKMEGGTIFYNATDDVALNTLGVTLRGDQIRFYDRGADNGITPPSQCSPGELDASGNPREVFCPRSGVDLVRIDVGEGQDEVTADLPIAVLVVGGNGADRIVTGPQNDTVNGDEGNDDIRTGEGNDTVVGGGGGDTILTAGGDDIAQGSLGADSIDTGAGNDDVRVRDGVVDQVACGLGTDKAQSEDGDRLADCESVDVIGATTGDGGTGSGTAGGPAGTSTGGAPGSASTRDDRSPPRLRAGGATRQKLGRRRTVLVLATVSEAAEVYATGYVEIGARRYALKRARADVTVGGGGAQLRVAMDRRTLGAARRALKRKRRVTVVVSVLATDRAGNSVPAKLPAIRLR
jgi:Ca2+-binding RTX toxin-like protein